MIVYISIGNSDDKLTQYEYSLFASGVTALWESDTRIHTHGRWTSSSIARWQNACWCVEFPDVLADGLKGRLRRLAKVYRQDSIKWDEAPKPEFLGAEVKA